MLEQHRYPPLGPLVAASLDKAVVVVVHAWPLMAATVVISVVGGALSPIFAFLPATLVVVYWAFAAYANAVRIERPDFRMGTARAFTLIGAYLFGGLATEFGFFLLVVPGIWIGNRLSMAAMVAVADELPLGDAFETSWRLTRNGFWYTLGFNIAVWLVMFGVTFAGYILIFILIAVPLHLALGSTAATWPAITLLALACCVFTIAICLTYQMHAIAQLHWLRALQRADNSPQ